MTTRVFSFLSLLLFVICPTLSHADVYSDDATWQSALCGTVIGDELDFGLPDGSISQQIGLNLTTAWGTITQPVDFTGFNFGPAPGTGSGFVVDETVAWVITPNGANGNVEGFSVGYVGNELTAIVTYADSSTETVIIPEAIDQNLAEQFFGWTNTSGQSVTSIQLSATDPDATTQAAFIYNLNFSFGDACPSGPASCQDQLQELIDGLYAALPNANTCDQYWIQNAILELEAAQNPLLWETSDRLSDFGCSFFGNNFYATYYLECVANDSLVEPSLIGIQNLLGCVVDAEIEYALANPNASTNLVAYAEYFESYAEAFADAELYLHAVILHFYAWLFANNA